MPDSKQRHKSGVGALALSPSSHAVKPCFDRARGGIYVQAGLGFYVEMSLAEARAFLAKKAAVLEKRSQRHEEQVADPVQAEVRWRLCVLDLCAQRSTWRCIAFLVLGGRR